MEVPQIYSQVRYLGKCTSYHHSRYSMHTNTHHAQCTVHVNEGVSFSSHWDLILEQENNPQFTFSSLIEAAPPWRITVRQTHAISPAFLRQCVFAKTNNGH